MEADQIFSGGLTYATDKPISGTTSQPLLQTERSGAFSYNIPVSSGRFRVTLYFSKTYCASYGKRIFTVNAEGSSVLSRLDVAQIAGPNAAMEKTFDVETADGLINLAFILNIQNANLFVLRIVHLRGRPAPVLGVLTPADFTAAILPSSATFAGTLTGPAAVDPSYRSVWEQTEGLALAEFLDPAAASISIRFNTDGIYSFRLSASCYSSTTGGSTRVNVPGDTTGQPPLRLRCGGSTYTHLQAERPAALSAET
jgi:hypothetical protein